MAKVTHIQEMTPEECADEYKRRNRIVSEKQIEKAQKNKECIIQKTCELFLEISGKALPKENVGVEIIEPNNVTVIILGENIPYGIDRRCLPHVLESMLTKESTLGITFRVHCPNWDFYTRDVSAGGTLEHSTFTGYNTNWKCRVCGSTYSKKVEIDKGHEVWHRRTCMNEQCRRVYRTIVPKGKPVRIPVGAYDVKKQDDSE